MSGIPIYDFSENPEDSTKLWNRIENDMGFTDMNMNRDRPYSGQPQTLTGIRGATEIKGITFRDLRDCFIRAFYQSAYDQNKELYAEANKGEDAALCENDLYKLDLNELDVMAVCKNLHLEIENLMGIFPNVPDLTASE